MARVLIVYSSFDGQTARIAERMASVITMAGHAVTLRDAPAAGADIERCDAVLVGGAIRYGRFSAALEQLARANQVALSRRPNAFFCVCLAARDPASGPRTAAGYLGKFRRRTGWQPQRTAVFAGALPYRRYGPLRRFMMRLISRAAGGDTDTSRDYEYTEWTAVERFAGEFAAGLQPATGEARAA